MTMTQVNRREVLAALAAAPLVDAGSPASQAAPALKPLPFNAAKLKGLSEKLLTSHHDNNYGGALKNLVKVRDELARVTKDTPAFVLGALKERELTYANSVVLHEAYFANLGGDGKVPAAFARFEEPLRACAVSQAGGSGWTVLSLPLDGSEPRVDFSSNHTQSGALTVPLLVLDMYEHSYALDYGAAAAKYVDAFFANVKWEEVQRRHEQALKMRALL
jgi:superoxide dismutase, Fe-Mn family